MSNIKKKDKYKKTVNMSLRLTEEQRGKIENAAKKNNMSISDYVVKKATESGRLRSSREYARICGLVKTEEAMGQLLKKIRATSPNKELIDCFNNTERVIRELWHF